jgi:hypothetical protein
MSDQTARIGMNEALFREVNERIDQLQGDLAGVETFRIVCECGTAGCTERFPITSEEYAALRAEATHFAVLAGHERPDIERVVATRDGYLIVEKTDPDAAEVAKATA